MKDKEQISVGYCVWINIKSYVSIFFKDSRAYVMKYYAYYFMFVIV